VIDLVLHLSELRAKCTIEPLNKYVDVPASTIKNHIQFKKRKAVRRICTGFNLIAREVFLLSFMLVAMWEVHCLTFNAMMAPAHGNGSREAQTAYASEFLGASVESALSSSSHIFPMPEIGGSLTLLTENLFQSRGIVGPSNASLFPTFAGLLQQTTTWLLLGIATVGIMLGMKLSLFSQFPASIRKYLELQKMHEVACRSHDSCWSRSDHHRHLETKPGQFSEQAALSSLVPFKEALGLDCLQDQEADSSSVAEGTTEIPKVEQQPKTSGSESLESYYSVESVIDTSCSNLAKEEALRASASSTFHYNETKPIPPSISPSPNQVKSIVLCSFPKSSHNGAAFTAESNTPPNKSGESANALCNPKRVIGITRTNYRSRPFTSEPSVASSVKDGISKCPFPICKQEEIISHSAGYSGMQRSPNISSVLQLAHSSKPWDESSMSSSTRANNVCSSDFIQNSHCRGSTKEPKIWDTPLEGLKGGKSHIRHNQTYKTSQNSSKGTEVQFSDTFQCQDHITSSCTLVTTMPGKYQHVPDHTECDRVGCERTSTKISFPSCVSSSCDSVSENWYLSKEVVHESTPTVLITCPSEGLVQSKKITPSDLNIEKR
jgi:hypothetical protein